MARNPIARFLCKTTGYTLAWFPVAICVVVFIWTIIDSKGAILLPMVGLFVVLSVIGFGHWIIEKCDAKDKEENDE